ncbi:MAG: hypothetical protein V3S38_00955 [Acidimicrobiia bacterium]
MEQSEPRTLPAPVGETESEWLPNGKVRFWANSAPVELGVRYRLSVGTHCGFGPIDFDGSFWDLDSGPVDPEGYIDGDVDLGVITLESENRAVFASSTGTDFVLIRIGDGPIELDPCA